MHTPTFEEYNQGLYDMASHLSCKSQGRSIASDYERRVDAGEDIKTAYSEVMTLISEAMETEIDADVANELFEEQLAKERNDSFISDKSGWEKSCGIDISGFVY